ncbi:MAG: DUF273 domain-containing protein [Candidatus Riflemargulisbacteria bacterium]
MSKLFPSYELKNSSNVCIVTAYTPDWKELGDLTSNTKKKYCDKLGYGLKIHTEGFDSTRQPSWSKILFIKNALKEYEYVFWIDANAIITNRNMRIEKFISLGGDIFICNENPEMIFDTGVFLIRSCDWSFGLLDEMWNVPGWNGFDLAEQTAFNQLVYNNTIGNRMVYYPMRTFNSLYMSLVRTELEWQPGDFIAHRKSVSSRDVIQGLTECLQKSGIVGI